MACYLALLIWINKIFLASELRMHHVTKAQCKMSLFLEILLEIGEKDPRFLKISCLDVHKCGTAGARRYTMSFPKRGICQVLNRMLGIERLGVEVK